MSELTIGSLFSGIGGLELGLEAAGVGRVVWQVEINPSCRVILAKHWPNVRRYVDVRTVGATELARVDLICGGFPCQDISSAGTGEGLDGERSGLWWEYHRIVGELRPRFAVVENVASGWRRWLCPVRSSLHALGYRTRALGIAARDVGAPHLRRRVFIIAWRGNEVADGDDGRREGERIAQPAREQGARGSIADRCGASRRVECAAGVPDADGVSGRLPERSVGRVLDGLPGGVDGHGSTQPVVIPRRFPAPPGEPQHTWEPPRTVGTERDTEALAALGNAVVPACAYLVGQVINQMRKDG